MSATIIPFPGTPRGSLGSLEVEMGRLAVLVHLRALRKGKPSSYEHALAICRRAYADSREPGGAG